MNPILHLTFADKWHDLALLSKSCVDGFGVLGAIMMLELVGEWLLSWTGLSGDVLEYQAQLADLLPAEAIKSLVLTSLLVFVPQLLQWLLLLLHLLLQSLNWPRLGQNKPVFSAPAQHDCVLRAANGCRAPPVSLSGI
ncbi:hypothetical protein [Oceanisphaera arctica]|uniref:hypothetical protein n=1 Tax=Oceanisphaera arctica TaxID=641510 RepID=UPI001E3A6D12|nr:hypothetical protein [Oceanisphaera arctica]